MPVGAVGVPHQELVSALVGDLPIINEDNVASLANGRQSVSNNHHDPVFCGGMQSANQGILGFGIKGSSGFIELVPVSIRCQDEENAS